MKYIVHCDKSCEVELSSSMKYIVHCEKSCEVELSGLVFHVL